MPLSVQHLINRLTFRQLQVFLSVYQTGSYSRAGQLLGLTQPAVSHQVRQLEAALGMPVFDYVARKLYCTAAGEKLAATIEAMFNDLRGLQVDLAALEKQVAGDLSLVAVTTAQYVVPHLLKAFVKRNPRVNVSVRVVNRAAAIEYLSENQVHLVIMDLVPEGKLLTSLPFLDNELLAVACHQHPLHRQPPRSIQAFLEAGLLMREKGSGSRLALEQFCQQRRLALKPILELGSNEAVKQGVLAGLGVTILPRLSIATELRLELLKVVPLQGFPLRRSWCAVYPKGKHPTPAVRAFINYLQDNLGDLSQRFARPC